MDHASYVARMVSDEATDTNDRPEFTYKLSEEELGKFVRLRATNAALFTGRRNAAKMGWRAILREMGLQKKMTTVQAKKKWENLKKKYKELKNPPPGAQVNPTSWRWFKLMDDAVEGRLAESDLSVSMLSVPNDSKVLVGKKSRERGRRPCSSEIELLIDGEDTVDSEDPEQGELEMDGDQDDIEQERAMLDGEKLALENERMILEWERMVLFREQAGVERERAALDRDWASLRREKASVERKRAAVERDRAQLEKERVVMEREWEWLEQDRTVLNRQKGDVSEDCPETSEEADKSTDLDLEPAVLERRQKFLTLFEKLIENF
ncbi:caldesmon [Chanos chanos]|uniref:Caldesmon n=1 Tax=Chanos chanos TaxID=29144 RepID=A0A6J2WMQ6_CHACN|nr:caldesmon-like [Chanos chanos]